MSVVSTFSCRSYRNFCLIEITLFRRFSDAADGILLRESSIAVAAAMHENSVVMCSDMCRPPLIQLTCDRPPFDAVCASLAGFTRPTGRCGCRGPVGLPGAGSRPGRRLAHLFVLQQVVRDGSVGSAAREHAPRRVPLRVPRLRQGLLVHKQPARPRRAPPHGPARARVRAVHRRIQLQELADVAHAQPPPADFVNRSNHRPTRRRARRRRVAMTMRVNVSVLACRRAAGRSTAAVARAGSRGTAAARSAERRSRATRGSSGTRTCIGASTRCTAACAARASRRRRTCAATWRATPAARSTCARCAAARTRTRRNCGGMSTAVTTTSRA